MNVGAITVVMKDEKNTDRNLTSGFYNMPLLSICFTSKCLNFDEARQIIK